MSCWDFLIAPAAISPCRPTEASLLLWLFFHCPSSSPFRLQWILGKCSKESQVPPNPSCIVRDLWASGTMCKIVHAYVLFYGILELLVIFLLSVSCLPSGWLCRVGCCQSWLFSKMLFLNETFWWEDHLLRCDSNLMEGKEGQGHTKINGLGCMREERVRDGKVCFWGYRKLQCQSTVEPRSDIALRMGICGTAYWKPIILASCAALCKKTCRWSGVKVPR